MTPLRPDQILAFYGLEAKSVARVGGTAGQTWRVESGGQAYFVRRRGPRTSTHQRIAFDHGLRRHLAEHNFCATPPLVGHDGRTWVESGGTVYEVYPWVDGQPMSEGLVDRVRVPAARALALFHEIASSYPEACEPLVPQFSNFEKPVAPRPRVDDPTAHLDVIDHMLDAYATVDNRAAMRRARERVQWLSRTYDAPLYKALPRYVIHGDYHADNMLFAADGRIVGLFDFDWAWRDVRVRDLADAVTFFGGRRTSPSVPGSIWSLTANRAFNVQPMLEVVRAYHAISPLSIAERRAIPLAVLARWVSQRTEGIMKVEADRRADFLLKDFDKPFEWFSREGASFVDLLRRMG